MKAYFAYTRVSTVKQGERGSSLQEQKSSIEAYAQRHGLSIAAWFEEMETAAKLGRRMFNQMLTEIEHGRAAGVIIHKIDRSARNLKDWAHLGELIDRGVDVHFAHESLDLASRGGRLSADIQAVVAADFIRNLKQEVRKGFYGRLKQGLYPLPAPTGYLNRGGGKAKEIDPQMGPLIRQTFEVYGAGAHSLDELRVEMHRRGLANRAGKPFSKNAVSKILHNPFYIGLIRLARTGETFQGVHPPLVTKALFNRAEAIMSGRAYLKSTRHDFVFKRLIECKQCSRSLTGELQKGNVYYRCHSPSCRKTVVRECDALAQARTLLSLLNFDEGELGDLRDFGDVARAQDAAEAAGRRDHLNMSIGRCTDLLTRLTDAFLDGSIDKEMFELRKTSLLEERRGLQDALEDRENDGPAVRLLKKFELGHMAYLQFDTPNASEKRDAVKIVSSNLVADGKELGFRLHFPFDQIIKQRISNDGGPCRVEVRTDGFFWGADDVTASPAHEFSFDALRVLKRILGVGEDTDLGTPQPNELP
jgi:site-specific DNA recombinase